MEEEPAAAAVAAVVAQDDVADEAMAEVAERPVVRRSLRHRFNSD